MKLLLPAIFDNLAFRKDSSVKLSFESRELTSEEITFLLGMRNCEGWLFFSPNEITDKDLEEIPEQDASVTSKTASQRMKSVLFVLYHQSLKNGTFKGEFEGYYKSRMEALIDQLKEKIEA